MSSIFETNKYETTVKTAFDLRVSKDVHFLETKQRRSREIQEEILSAVGFGDGRKKYNWSSHREYFISAVERDVPLRGMADYIETMEGIRPSSSSVQSALVSLGLKERRRKIRMEE